MDYFLKSGNSSTPRRNVGHFIYGDINLDPLIGQVWSCDIGLRNVHERGSDGHHLVSWDLPSEWVKVRHVVLLH